MKLKFKHQQFQKDAAQAVIDVFFDVLMAQFTQQVTFFCGREISRNVYNGGSISVFRYADGRG